MFAAKLGMDGIAESPPVAALSNFPDGDRCRKKVTFALIELDGSEWSRLRTTADPVVTVGTGPRFTRKGSSHEFPRSADVYQWNRWQIGCQKSIWKLRRFGYRTRKSYKNQSGDIGGPGTTSGGASSGSRVSAGQCQPTTSRRNGTPGSGNAESFRSPAAAAMTCGGCDGPRVGRSVVALRFDKPESKRDGSVTRAGRSFIGSSDNIDDTTGRATCQERIETVGKPEHGWKRQSNHWKQLRPTNQHERHVVTNVVGNHLGNSVDSALRGSGVVACAGESPLDLQVLCRFGCRKEGR